MITPDYYATTGRPEVLLFTSLVRADLFTWQEQIGNERGGSDGVDTWTITDHPLPDGTTTTLYACTMVYLHTKPAPLAAYTPTEMLDWMSEGISH